MAYKLLLLALFGLGLGACSMSRTVIPESDPEVFDGVQGPKILSAGELEYPSYVQNLGIQGVIHVKARVTIEGRADSTEILSRQFNYQAIQLVSGGLRPVAELFDPLAIKFMKTVVYQPAMKEGRPVEVWIVQPVRWKLPE